MPPIFSKVQNKKLHGQSREIVCNVLTFFKEEARQWNGNNFLVPVKKCQERCSKATGVSVSTIHRITKEAVKLNHTPPGEAASFVTPDKKRENKKNITDLDEFNKAVVRRTVHNFYVADKCVPTVEKLRLRLSEAIDFKGSNTSLRRILKELGFKWRKTRNNRKILMEREDIRNRRINFIRQMRQFRRERRPIVYTDETYVVTNHSTPSSWQDSTNGGLHVPVGNGDRLIIVHAGGEDGFIPNTFLQWKASQSTGDYHKNMNSVNYEKWVQEKLLPNLTPRSVLIIDNASYHNVKLDKIPTKSSLKVDMQAWLTQHNINFTPTMFKAELLNLIQQNKPPTRYSLDEIIERNGHTILRLPPYHPDLNAIELIWSQIKGYVAERNTQFNMNSIMKLVETKVSEIGASEWEKCCSHVKNIEDQYFEREQLIDEFHDAVIVNLGASDSEDSDDADEPSEGEEMDLSGIEEL